MAQRRHSRRPSGRGQLEIWQVRSACVLVLLGTVGVIWRLISVAQCSSLRTAISDASTSINVGSGRVVGAAGGQRKRVSGEQGFIYVYELPPKFNKGMRKERAAWHDVQYEAEKMFHEWLEEGQVGHQYRTYDPDSASLFYMPIYSSYYINLVCAAQHTTKMEEAVKASSALVEEAIAIVRHSYPFWNASHGANHFTTATYDHGRCSAMAYVPFHLTREMFTLQMNGDWHVRSLDSVGDSGLRVLAFNGAEGRRVDLALPDVACYRMGHDVVIPAATLENMLDPFYAPRSTLLLGSFARSVLTKDGIDKPIRHHRHAVRDELWEIYEREKPEGWLFATKRDILTHTDMKASKFCACPPGNSQWTSRFVKSILTGCIPVTFSKEHDQPWQDSVDYSKFSINIDPDDVKSLEGILKKLANETEKLQAMQASLKRHQRLFSYDHRLENGTLGTIVEALRARSKRDNTHGFQRISKLLL